MINSLTKVASLPVSFLFGPIKNHNQDCLLENSPSNSFICCKESAINEVGIRMGEGLVLNWFEFGWITHRGNAV